MSEPIVFVSHSRVKPGKLEDFKKLTQETFPQMEADKPGTVMHYGYLDEEGTEVHFVHVFPDADAMDAHMAGVAERSQKAFEFIESEGFDIYGAPSDEVLSMMQQAPGVDLVVKPLSLGGYIRLGGE